MAKKIGRYEIIGQTIEELIPYHDGATIILSNGKEFDLGIDPEEISEPNHPEIVKKINKLEDRLYDATYGKEDKAKQADYKKQLKELKDSLVGIAFTYNKKPCRVKEVISKDNENSVIIEQDNKTKKIYLYSLER